MTNLFLLPFLFINWTKQKGYIYIAPRANVQGHIFLCLIHVCKCQRFVYFRLSPVPFIWRGATYNLLLCMIGECSVVYIYIAPCVGFIRIRRFSTFKQSAWFQPLLSAG